MSEPNRQLPSFGQRAQDLFKRLSRWMDEPEAAPVAPTVVVRRRSVIHEGRMRLYYEAILFGDNPFNLERYGQVSSQEDQPLESLEPWAEDAVRALRYYVCDPHPYASVEEAAQTWGPVGASLCTPPNRR